MLQNVRNPLNIGGIFFLKFLVHAKAIFRLLDFGAGREEGRDKPALAIDLVPGRALLSASRPQVAPSTNCAPLANRVSVVALVCLVNGGHRLGQAAWLTLTSPPPSLRW